MVGATVTYTQIVNERQFANWLIVGRNAQGCRKTPMFSTLCKLDEFGRITGGAIAFLCLAASSMIIAFQWLAAPSMICVQSFTHRRDHNISRQLHIDS